jgi:hypothetical protein
MMKAGTSENVLRRVFRTALGLAALAGATLFSDLSVAEGPEDPVMITVENATAKVGEKTAIQAKIMPREGFRITEGYRNRIIELSAFDKGVEFDGEVVRGALQDGGLVFSVGVTPTKPGAHTINGLFRISFHNGQRMDMKSFPLIATVTGTE